MTSKTVKLRKVIIYQTKMKQKQIDTAAARWD